jgi:triacylglycerol esterase/lipase EstA (alpha/beta hydrolase family)
MRRRITALLGTVAVAVGALVASPSGAATAQYPVPYTFLSSAITAGLAMNSDAPGSNIWTCKPSTAHPEPVVLTHGLLGDKSTNWQTYAPLLANNGYCVYALTYGVNPGTPTGFDQFGGLARVEDSAAQLAAFVKKVLAATGARKVDIVGHSEGTVMPDYYIKFLGGARYVDKYVSLAPLWHGTDPAGLATLAQLGNPFGVTPQIFAAMSSYFASGPELLTGSAFWAKLRSGGTPAVRGVRYTNIVTKYDELVSPYTSGIQTGMTNYTVQDFCSTDYAEHFEIAADPVAAQLVLNALDPAHPAPVPCTLVLPFEGTPG